MAIVHYGMSSMSYFIFLSLSLLPYFFFFTYFDAARLNHRQHKNVFKIELVSVTDKKIGVFHDVKRVQGEETFNDDGSIKSPEPSNAPSKLQISKTHRVKKNLNMSFNSSDIEAYREESPIPVVKEAYFEYMRAKRKA